MDKLEQLKDSFSDPSKHLAFAGDLADQKNIEDLVKRCKLPQEKIMTRAGDNEIARRSNKD